MDCESLIITMANCYSEKLNASFLQRCYETAPERVRQFLEAEIKFVLSKVRFNDILLDLGCGYGRVSVRLLEKARKVYGIDISGKNIDLAKKLFPNDALIFLEMNAISLNFPNDFFDLTLCIQNGISAFKVDPEKLLTESLRVTKTGGKILFSSYSSKFWNERLKWFELQANQGLIGEIDYNLTKDGTIVCKDGFRAITFSENDFVSLASTFNIQGVFHEVDDSSLFFEIVKK